jgi:hypothetical protein
MNPIKRRIAIVLLSLGTIGGFAGGAISTARHVKGACARRAAFEQHVAKVCVDAARNSGAAHDTNAK